MVKGSSKLIDFKQIKILKKVLNDLPYFETLIKTVYTLPLPLKELNNKLIENKVDVQEYEKVFYDLSNSDEYGECINNIFNFFNYMLDSDNDYMNDKGHLLIQAFNNDNFVEFSPKVLYLNFYIVQDWIVKTKPFPLPKLNKDEILLLAMIIQGFTPNELAENTPFSKEYIENHLYHMLPQKFGVTDFLQVLAKIFYSVPNYIACNNFETIFESLKKILI